MNITDLKASLDYLVKAELTPFIWGHAGVGKSTSVRQWADTHGYKFFAFYLGTQSDLGDILGLQEFVRNPEGRAIATEFAIPLWLRETIDYCEANPNSGAVIFLDEFNRARRDILNGMFSLALDKTFHTLKLPRNCHVIAAGNPPTEEYFTTDIDETALMARFVHIKLEPTFNEWITYAKTKNFESSLIGFIQEQPQLLEQHNTEFKLPVKVDKRAWERLSKLFALKTPEHLLEQLMAGIVGLERTIAYQQYRKNSDKPLTGQEVLNKDKWALLEKWCNPTNIMASFSNLTCDNVFEELEKMAKAGMSLNKTQNDNLMEFLIAVPKDIVFPLIAKLVECENSTFKEFYLTKGNDVKMKELINNARGKNENG